MPHTQITQPNDIAAIAIQRVFRTFSVQLYLQRNHLKLQSKEAICQNHQIELNSMWQDEHKNIAAQRVKKDFHNKRIFERLFGIRVLYGHKKKLVQIVEQESKTLIVRHQHCNELHTKYKNRMHTQDKDILDQNKTLSSYHSQSSHKIHSSTLKKLQTELKVLKAKKKNSEYLASLHLRAMHDIETQFRHLLRIRQKSMLLSQKSHDYLQLLEKEAETFRSILNFVSNKINSVELAKGSVYYMEWLNEQKQILTNYLICYDTDHELTISNETRRLCKELEYVSSAIKAFMQLWNTLLAQCSLIAEMIGPEIEQHRSDGKDENALIHIDRIHMLNIKQRMLRETIIPEIDYYLKTHYQNMEKDMRLAGVKCIGDKPTSNLENLSCSIYAVMCNDDNKLRQLFQMSDWMELFDSRPWIGNQIVAETRLDHRHEMERERLEQQLLALNEKKRTHTFDSEKALSIEKIMIDLQNESKQKGKSKFKQKEIIDAYETLKKTQNKFKQISLSREGAIISEEERIKYGFDNLMKQEDESKKRKEYLKRFNEEFESTETGVDEKSKADLNREKLWLKKEELSLQALVEKECDFEKTNTDYHQFKQSTENKSCNMSTLDTINNISQNELSKRYHSFKKRKEKYELNCCEVNRSLEKRRNLQKEARLQAVYALEQEQLKEIQKKIRQGRERLLAKSLLSIKYDNEIIEWPPNSEMLRINKLIESRYPDKDKADAVDLEDLVKRGTHLIQGIRQVTKRQNEDMEEKQMMITIRKRMALQQKKVVAISKLRFTVGKLETDKFAKENFDLQDRGLPFFRRVGKEIGVQDQLVIWALYTSDDKDFITSIKVSRAFVGRPLPIDLVEQGYDIIQHERMKGESVKDPSLCLWYKKDRKFSKAICDISVSYCSKDEEELLLEDFEKIEENLIKFGLSESYLWFRLIDRKALKKLGNPKHMADQYEEYCKMLANNPNDSILKDLVEKMRRRLRNVQLEEEKRFERKKGPVEDTADFLSMSSNDLEKFQKIYKKIDKDRDGYISLDEFRIFIGKPEEMSRYSNHIFILSIGHPPNDDRLDFGISLKAISMFCMFSKEETLKFIFSIYDKKGFGSIENDEFFQLLTMLHPNQRGRTTRALHEFDLPKSGRMNFDFFVSVHMRFPNMLFPAFDFQVSYQSIIFFFFTFNKV